MDSIRRTVHIRLVPSVVVVVVVAAILPSVRITLGPASCKMAAFSRDRGTGQRQQRSCLSVSRHVSTSASVFMSVIVCLAASAETGKRHFSSFGLHQLLSECPVCESRLESDDHAL